MINEIRTFDQKSFCHHHHRFTAKLQTCEVSLATTSKMTWFVKTFVLCAALVLLGITLEIVGHTQWTCKRKCKNETDNILCARWMSTADGSQYAPGKKMRPEYQWMRNACEMKCFQFGVYNETVDMDFCTKAGQNYTTYRCSDVEYYESRYQKCLANKSMH